MTHLGMGCPYPATPLSWLSHFQRKLSKHRLWPHDACCQFVYQTLLRILITGDSLLDRSSSIFKVQQGLLSGQYHRVSLDYRIILLMCLINGHGGEVSSGHVNDNVSLVPQGPSCLASELESIVHNLHCYLRRNRGSSHRVHRGTVQSVLLGKNGSE